MSDALILHPNHPGNSEGVSDRFWAKVQKTDTCWLWAGAQNAGGYGQFSVGGIMTSAHRVSYEIHFGPIPEGMYVLHKCRNKHCVAPHHLEAGTPAKNSGPDRYRDGTMTHLTGELHGMSKLTETQVLSIRSMYRNGTSQKKLSLMYGVGQDQISRIVNKKSWSHLP